MSKKNTPIFWLDQPESHDYPAAQSYLELLYSPTIVKKYVGGLKKAPMSVYKAKDIFRASGLSLLGISNLHVKKNIKKIHNKESLSPLLLVRDVVANKLIIADGYHRLCAVYEFNEDAVIPCKIV